MKRSEFFKRAVQTAAGVLVSGVAASTTQADEPRKPEFVIEPCPACGSGFGPIQLSGYHAHVEGDLPDAVTVKDGFRSGWFCSHCFKPVESPWR